MAAYSAEEAGSDLVRLIARVSDSHEPIEIMGEKGVAVLLSREDWQAILETLHLTAIPGMAQSIREGMATPISECERELDW